MKQLGYFPILAMAVASVATQARAQPTPSIDPDAIAALNKVGTYLRELKAFQIRAAITSEEVLEDGQKVAADSAADLLVEKPNKMRLEASGDRQNRLFLYDGKTFTLSAQRMNMYATVPAPATLAELVDKLQEKFDIELPLVDMFYWGTERSQIGQITSAIDFGPSSIDGVTCEQFAFRQPGVDWQLWIQQGDYPLPRKLLISTLEDEARPQYTAVYTWNLAPSFNDTAFVFEAPKDASKISFAEVKPPQPGNK